jgi:hypothetical protein
MVLQSCQKRRSYRHWSGNSGRKPLGWVSTAAAMRLGALDQVPDEGPADSVAQHHEPIDAQVIHQADMVVGEGVPRRTAPILSF